MMKKGNSSGRLKVIQTAVRMRKNMMMKKKSKMRRLRKSGAMKKKRMKKLRKLMKKISILVRDWLSLTWTGIISMRWIY